MASIRKRRNKFNVVYYYTNDQGERKQKWEPFDTEEEAKTRKAEIEYKMKVNTFIAPSNLTVAALLEDFSKRKTPQFLGITVFLVRQKGFEPPASPLGGARSIQLSY